MHARFREQGRSSRSSRDGKLESILPLVRVRVNRERHLSPSPCVPPWNQAPHPCQQPRRRLIYSLSPARFRRSSFILELKTQPLALNCCQH